MQSKRKKHSSSKIERFSYHSLKENKRVIHSFLIAKEYYVISAPLSDNYIKNLLQKYADEKINQETLIQKLFEIINNNFKKEIYEVHKGKIAYREHLRTDQIITHYYFGETPSGISPMPTENLEAFEDWYKEMIEYKKKEYLKNSLHTKELLPNLEKEIIKERIIKIKDKYFYPEGYSSEIARKYKRPELKTEPSIEEKAILNAILDFLELRLKQMNSTNKETNSNDVTNEHKNGINFHTKFIDRLDLPQLKHNEPSLSKEELMLFIHFLMNAKLIRSNIKRTHLAIALEILTLFSSKKIAKDYNPYIDEYNGLFDSKFIPYKDMKKYKDQLIKIETLIEELLEKVKVDIKSLEKAT